MNEKGNNRRINHWEDSQISPVPAYLPIERFDDGEFEAEIFRSERARERAQKIFDSLREGIDYGTIAPAFPGPQVINQRLKVSLWKAGAEILLQHYRLHKEFDFSSLEVIKGRLETDPRIRYRVICRVYDEEGYMRGVGIGGCNSLEPRLRYIEQLRRCPICSAATLRHNQIEGKGWYCWSKIGGCGVTYAEGDPRIIHQDTIKAEREPWANDNSMSKMAKKRALVDAAIDATKTSWLFTQDIDEDEEGGTGKPPTAPQPAGPPLTGNAPSSPILATEPPSVSRPINKPPMPVAEPTPAQFAPAPFSPTKVDIRRPPLRQKQQVSDDFVMEEDSSAPSIDEVEEEPLPEGLLDTPQRVPDEEELAEPIEESPSTASVSAPEAVKKEEPVTSQQTLETPVESVASKPSPSSVQRTTASPKSRIKPAPAVPPALTDALEGIGFRKRTTEDSVETSTEETQLHGELRKADEATIPPAPTVRPRDSQNSYTTEILYLMQNFFDRDELKQIAEEVDKDTHYKIRDENGKIQPKEIRALPENQAGILLATLKNRAESNNLLVEQIMPLM